MPMVIINILAMRYCKSLSGLHFIPLQHRKQSEIQRLYIFSSFSVAVFVTGVRDTSLYPGTITLTGQQVLFTFWM